MVEGLFFTTLTPEATSWITGGGAIAVLGTVCGKLYYRGIALEERNRNDLIESVKAVNELATTLKDVTKTNERNGEIIKELRAQIADLAKEVRAK